MTQPARLQVSVKQVSAEAARQIEQRFVEAARSFEAVRGESLIPPRVRREVQAEVKQR